MSESDAQWNRDHWSPGGGDAFLFYVIYGDIDVTAPLRGSIYRTAGLPEGVDVRSFTRSQNADYLRLFEEGHVWDALVESDPALAHEVEASNGCLVLQGTVADPASLEYLRDAIGFVTFFVDHGGVAVYDIQSMKWWSPEKWRSEIFEPDAPDPCRHVIILYSGDDDEGVGTWFHTRGMRKFGRPDISIRDVPPHQFDAVAALCNRLIACQAHGSVIPERHEVRVAGLERAGVVRHCGDYEDDDFNNVHFEVEWQGNA